MPKRPPPAPVEFTAAAPGAAVEALRELVVAGGGWVNLNPEVNENDAIAVTPSAVGALFRVAGKPIPQATLIAPTQGRRDRKPAQLGISHGVGAMVVGRLADDGIPLPEGWKVVQDHVRRGLILRLEDPLDEERAVTWAIRAATAMCPIPTTGRWLAEVHQP